MRNIAQSIWWPIGLRCWRIARLRWERLRWPAVCLHVFFAVIVGMSGAALAKGKLKTWAPPIPPERAAITLAVRTVNAANAKVPAKVMWGRRLLGETPLYLRWPADSGPVDIVVLAQGYVPVHTRLYTFSDERVVVKLVDNEGKKALFGYKRELPSAGAAAPDPKGAVPVPSTPVPSDTSSPAATPPPPAPIVVQPPAVAP